MAMRACDVAHVVKIEILGSIQHGQWVVDQARGTLIMAVRNFPGK